VDWLKEVPKQIDLNSPTEFSICLPDPPSSLPVTVELRSLVDGSVDECKVTEAEGKCTVSVLPTCRGRHELTISAGGTPLEGTPLKILVCCPPQMLGRPVNIINGVSRPAGVALRGNGELVVTETEPAAVCIRDREGKVIKSLEQGSPQLDNPYGVAIDSEGCVYVAELINCKVHKFSRDGEFLKAVGGECSSKEDVAFPAGIKINHNDHIYICDDTNKKVHVFDKNLDKLFSFGESGETPGHFQSPSDVAFDADGNVFVADTKREKIMKFSARGEFSSEFEIKGQSSELELGICVGPSGHLFVSNFWNHQVVVFDATGQFVTSFGRKGAEPGEFDTPAGITVDDDGFVYVCDQLNSRIQVF
jgi:DNA-binding beta-propeller fold protein YncE